MNYPLMFHSTTASEPGTQTAWRTRSGELSSTVAIPPEFEGPGGGLSPEDLFNHALVNCFVATFKVYAEKSKLVYRSVEADATLAVDLDDAKRPIMKALSIRVRVHGAENVDRAKLLAEKAARSGFILNSVKTVLNFEFEFLN